MPTDNIKKLKHNIYVRLGAGVLIAFAAYAFFLWAAAHMVDKNRLRSNITDWVKDKFGYQSQASTGEVDLALRLNGRADMYIHDFELDTPDAHFALPWLYVDTFRLSAPVYSLFGGVEVEPVVQVRDAILRMRWDQAGRMNLSGLKWRRDDWDRPFLRGMNISSISFPLINSRLHISKSGFDFSGRINGVANLDKNTLGFKFDMPSVIMMSDQGVRRKFVCSLDIKEGECDFSSGELKRLMASVKNIPLSVVSAFSEHVMGFPSDALFSGEISADAGEWKLSGGLTGLDLLVFNGAVKVKAGWQLEGINLDSFKAEFSAEDTPSVMAIACSRNQQGKWKNFDAYLNSFDLSLAKNVQLESWLGYISRHFESLNVNCDYLSYGRFTLQKVAANILLRKNGMGDVSLSGEIGGGSASVVAKDFSISKIDLPNSLLGVVTIKDAGRTLPYFTRFIPDVFNFTPTRGTGEMTFSYDRGGSLPGAGVSYSVQLQLKDVVVAVVAGGGLLSTLSEVNNHLLAAENLCRRARINGKATVVKSSNLFSQLHFKSIKLSYEISPGGLGRLIGLVASSDELGDIEAVGAEHTDGSFRMRLFLKNIPAALVDKNTALSPEVKAITTDLAKNDGLRFECISSQTGSKVEPVFVEDIFRIWSEKFASGTLPASGKENK